MPEGPFQALRSPGRASRVFPGQYIHPQSIRALGRDLSKLADEAVTRTITFNEFENIRVSLMDLGFALKPEHVLDATA